MGLTLNYRLRVRANVTAAAIPALVAAMHAAAWTMQRAGRLDEVSAMGSEPEDLFWHSEWLQVRVPGEENTCRGIEVPASEGRVFAVSLGEGCEPLRLGLCRYPEQVIDPITGKSRTVRRRGWRLAGFCKTQYASLHGWEHFHRVHTTAVELLIGLRALGLRVKVMDEGGYWPGRNAVELRRQLERMNGLVAAFAGALKDATEDADSPPLQAPIFAHPHFERLEAAGAEQEGAAITQAVKLIRRSRPPGRNVT